MLRAVEIAWRRLIQIVTPDRIDPLVKGTWDVNPAKFVDRRIERRGPRFRHILGMYLGMLEPQAVKQVISGLARRSDPHGKSRKPLAACFRRQIECQQ